MMKTISWTLSLLTPLILNCAVESAGSTCDEVQAALSVCYPDIPHEAQCSEAMLERFSSVDIETMSCEELDDPGAADIFSFSGCAEGERVCANFFCCDDSYRVTLREAAKVSSLSEVCPASTSGSLCEAMTGSQWEDAGQLLRQELDESAQIQAELTRPEVRYYIRERALSLFVWNTVTKLGTESVPGIYGFEAQKVVSEHFPIYESGVFPLSVEQIPPAAPRQCTEPEAALFVFPGVVRLEDLDEFDEQRAAIEAAIPCLTTVRVESESCVPPESNAMIAQEAIAEFRATHGSLPLHFLGYSQGSRNVLQTLTAYPDIAADVRTVITMNSAAHGSEVADTLFDILQALRGGRQTCDETRDELLSSCVWAEGRSESPLSFLVDKIADSLNTPPEGLRGFLEQDGLTTWEADDFWATQGHLLPQHVLYLSFRSVVSDEDSNLPRSNQLTFDILQRVSDEAPHNDMQVRLVRQGLSGPVANLEVQSPVAEGNHWQWELRDYAVPEAIMPLDMTRRIPHRELLLGYYQALDEVGLLLD